jgi:hypothetical protein
MRRRVARKNVKQKIIPEMEIGYSDLSYYK